MTELYRKEVFEYRAKASRLSGDVMISVPIAWQAIGYLMFASFVVGVAYLSLASYTRVETVRGSIIPDKGVASVVSTRNGVIESVLAQDGQHVTSGAVLATIRSEDQAASRLSSAAQLEEAISRQDNSLADQQNIVSTASSVQVALFERQRLQIISEIEQLQSQIAIQRDLIEFAQKDFDGIKEISKRGFLSRRDVQTRQENLLLRKQGLAQLLQSVASRNGALKDIERSLKDIAAQAKVQVASLQASRAQVAQQAANAAGSRSYTLRAPISGRVTALTARVGQSVTNQTPLLQVIPDGSTLRAELAVPSSAVGFIKKGQRVRLGIDAFSYQRFGTINGQIVSVAQNSVVTQGDSGTTTTVFPVVVELSQATISAYGERRPLVAGMTLTARIETEKQSLLEWAFAPLFTQFRR